jgi:hypothetical protein
VLRGHVAALGPALLGGGSGSRHGVGGHVGAPKIVLLGGGSESHHGLGGHVAAPECDIPSVTFRDNNKTCDSVDCSV